MEDEVEQNREGERRGGVLVGVCVLVRSLRWPPTLRSQRRRATTTTTTTTSHAVSVKSVLWGFSGVWEPPPPPSFPHPPKTAFSKGWRANGTSHYLRLDTRG